MKPLSEVVKHFEEVVADKYAIDPQIQARVVDKMFNRRDAEDVHEQLAQCLDFKKQRVTQNRRVQKENIY